MSYQDSNENTSYHQKQRARADLPSPGLEAAKAAERLGGGLSSTRTSSAKARAQEYGTIIANLGARRSYSSV